MKKTTTTLALTPEPHVEDWPAWESGVPGLVVCRRPVTWKKESEVVPGDRWQINHAPSGQVMGPSFRLRREALAFCKVLAPLCDWTMSATELGPIVERLKPRITALWNELG